MSATRQTYRFIVSTLFAALVLGGCMRKVPGMGETNGKSPDSAIPIAFRKDIPDKVTSNSTRWFTFEASRGYLWIQSPLKLPKNDPVGTLTLYRLSADGKQVKTGDIPLGQRQLVRLSTPSARYLLSVSGKDSIPRLDYALRLEHVPVRASKMVPVVDTYKNQQSETIMVLAGLKIDELELTSPGDVFRKQGTQYEYLGTCKVGEIVGKMAFCAMSGKSVPLNGGSYFVRMGEKATEEKGS